MTDIIKRMPRITISTLLAALFVAFCPLISQAADTSIEVSQVIAAGSKCLITAELPQAEQQVKEVLSDPSSDYLKAAVKLENGGRQIFPISYDTSQLSDASAGLFWLHGTIEPPAGYSIASDISAVTALVFLCDPNVPSTLPVLKGAAITNPQVILPAGSSSDELLNKLNRNKEFTLYLEDDFYYCPSLNWNPDEIALDTPGNQTATGTPALPEGLLLPETFASVSCEVCIQDAARLTLSPPVIDQYTLLMGWCKDTPDEDLFQFCYAVEDGPWQEDTEGNLMELSYDQQHVEVNLSGNTSRLLETPYYFRIGYDGEYSNTVKVFLTDGMLNYLWYEGDRDGGDREEQTLPDPVPPENQLPDSQSPDDQIPDSSPLPEEADTEHTTTWSGARIKAYQKANPGAPLLLEKHRIRMELPISSPLFSDLNSQDSLHVEIEALSGNTFRLEIIWNGSDILGTPVTVTIPWEEHKGTSNLQVKDEDGNIITEADYIAEEGCIVFAIEKSGIYTIESASSTKELSASFKGSSESSSASFPWAVSALAVTMVAAGSALLLLRRQKRRED